MTFRPFTGEAEIERIGLGFLDRTLPKAEWTHAAHFAATLWLMRHRPEMDLPIQMPGMIRAYNEATGGVNSDTEGYHETITQASIRAARDWLSGHHPATPVFELVNALMASRLGRSDWLFAYWSRPTLFSVEARRRWVAPEVAPLPFRPPPSASQGRSSALLPRFTGGPPKVVVGAGCGPDGERARRHCGQRPNMIL